MSEDLVIAELMVLRTEFDTNRQKSLSMLRRATWTEARDAVDDRLAALGVSPSGGRS